MLDTQPGEPHGTGNHKSAIVMISIGKRPWAESCAETFKHYSETCSASLHIETETPSKDEFPFPDLPDKPGRNRKIAYACKAYFVWKYLVDHGFDRVAIIDDTCCVRAGTPSIFDVVPFGMCGYTRTSGAHAEDSFEVIRAFIKERGESEISYDATRYMNSGVMVYDRTMREAFHKERICRSASLLFARFPNQTLTYYLLRSGQIPQHELPKKFNTMPALGLAEEQRRELNDIRPYLKDGICIYHLSALYRNRASLLAQLTEILLREWKN
jgi:hypothetical protein